KLSEGFIEEAWTLPRTLGYSGFKMGGEEAGGIGVENGGGGGGGLPLLGLGCHPGRDKDQGRHQRCAGYQRDQRSSIHNVYSFPSPRRTELPLYRRGTAKRYDGEQITSQSGAIEKQAKYAIKGL